ncbi:transglycosylase SLT domain-containing protein [Psychrobacter sp. FDAARGOS_221]|uniref:transglycosylase SLT domain-containing protein n=1 Tax=Psychrobacter sp. FDAARGOS_221 TaxID=1975705 RepID=UPI000BB55D1A|nr:transglycosylase SLT domain-containing protein [Psychrobacter sp. FDAARGOS_221]PNK59906.1 lytic transglycosylase [Psychrobacter sp. FDAARGOS_221]
MQRMTYWYKSSKASHTHLPIDNQQLAYCQDCHPVRKSVVNTQGFYKPQPNKNINKPAPRLTDLSLLDKLNAYLDRDTKHKKWTKNKLIASITLASLSVIGISNFAFSGPEPEAYSTVMATKTLTLASVAGDSTFFSTDGFQHGFGYDIARSYANELGVTLLVKNFDNEVEALHAVSTGEADMALTTASTQLIEKNDVTAINISCGFDSSLTQNGLNPRTSWSFRSNQDQLAVQASHFLCQNGQLINTANIANFYDQTLLKDDYNRKHFEKVMANNLPLYLASFQEQAENYDHDWQLLVAMGYQESQLDANAVSPTGVRGLMMLTNNTAEAMGVSNRVDPYQSIGGGARYLEQLKERFSDIPNPDRIWFALASYNMGPNAIAKIQDKLSLAGKDPNSWANVYSYMLDNATSNSRYVQCMHYVTSIRSYLETLKSQTNLLT